MLKEKFLEERKERFESNRGLNGFETKRKLAEEQGEHPQCNEAFIKNKVFGNMNRKIQFSSYQIQQSSVCNDGILHLLYPPVAYQRRVFGGIINV